jgi:hypothetical protein
MISLRLAVRTVLGRAGLSIALVAVISFAVAVGAAGAIYLRAADLETGRCPATRSLDLPPEVAVSRRVAPDGQLAAAL